MSTATTFQPTLELLSTKVAQAQYEYALAVLTIFKDVPCPHQELVRNDIVRLMDAHANRGVSVETVSDLLRITELVKKHGWALFQAIDESTVTESITKLCRTYGLTVGAGATLFYTRTTLEPVRYMLGWETR